MVLLVLAVLPADYLHMQLKHLLHILEYLLCHGTKTTRCFPSFLVSSNELMTYNITVFNSVAKMTLRSYS